MACLVLPRCNTAVISPHLTEIATTVAPGTHAVQLLDQAGWHLLDRLEMPLNIALIPLPPKCPELNPVENTWQFMRENWLSNASSAATTTSSTIAAVPGTASFSNPGPSCPSGCAIGLTDSDQRDSV